MKVNHNSNGIGFVGALTIAFVVLKLMKIIFSRMLLARLLLSRIETTLLLLRNGISEKDPLLNVLRSTGIHIG